MSGEVFGRVAMGLATGGASEAVRGISGIFTQKQERKEVSAAEDKAAADKAALAGAKGPADAQSVAQAEAKAAAADQAAGTARTKKAGQVLKAREAKGFGPNPNVAKPFLLAL